MVATLAQPRGLGVAMGDTAVADGPTFAAALPTAEGAQVAADAELGAGPGQVAVVVEDVSGRGWRWQICDADTEPPADVWLVAVRTWDGVWLQFASQDHAAEFLRCELAVVAARRRLVATATHGAADPGQRQLDAAARWAAVLTSLRAERELLYPTP